jgi:hypothetical protein
MNFLDYQHDTADTAIYPDAGSRDSFTGLAYVTMGLAGEAGEICNKVKKIARDNGGVIGQHHRNMLVEELGDVLCPAGAGGTSQPRKADRAQSCWDTWWFG